MLRGAPTEAALDATTRVELAPSMWADVSPSMPPREHPPAINGLVKVVATQGSLAGKGIAIDHVWIVKGSDVWEATDPPESDSQDPAYTDAQGVARNRPDSPEFTIALRAGPPWGAEGKIFVVVRIVTPGGDGVPPARSRAADRHRGMSSTRGSRSTRDARTPTRGVGVRPRRPPTSSTRSALARPPRPSPVRICS